MSRIKESTKERTRKVFAPILVGEELKEEFNQRKGTRTADEYLRELLDNE